MSANMRIFDLYSPPERRRATRHVPEAYSVFEHILRLRRIECRTERNLRHTIDRPRKRHKRTARTVGAAAMAATIVADAMLHVAFWAERP